MNTSFVQPKEWVSFEKSSCSFFLKQTFLHFSFLFSLCLLFLLFFSCFLRITRFFFFSFSFSFFSQFVCFFLYSFAFFSIRLLFSFYLAKPISQRNRLVFGQPLEVINEREGCLIPRIVTSCIDFILIHGMFKKMFFPFFFSLFFSFLDFVRSFFSCYFLFSFFLFFPFLFFTFFSAFFYTFISL